MKTMKMKITNRLPKVSPITAILIMFIIMVTYFSAAQAWNNYNTSTEQQVLTQLNSTATQANKTATSTNQIVSSQAEFKLVLGEVRELNQRIVELEEASESRSLRLLPPFEAFMNTSLDTLNQLRGYTAFLRANFNETMLAETYEEYAATEAMLVNITIANEKLDALLNQTMQLNQKNNGSPSQPNLTGNRPFLR